MDLYVSRKLSNWGNYQTNFERYLASYHLLDSDGLYHSSNLCSNCEKLSSLLTFAPGLDDNSPGQMRELLFAWAFDNFCPLCVFIRDVRLYATGYKYRHPHGHTLQLGNQSGFLGLYHLSTREVESPLIVSLVPAYEEGPDEVRGRLFQRDKADFDILRGWISQCSERHDCGKMIAPLELSRFCLIDCNESKVVPIYNSHGSNDPNIIKNVRNAIQYVALSYVWGEQSQHPSCLTSPLEAPCLLRNIPQVVADAMEAVKKMGYVYLWVDRYCIPQGKTRRAAAIMEDHLPKMGIIYANAVFTIIAAAGSDPSHGLPGVSGLRDRQPAIKVGDYTLVGVVNPALAISSSKWDHRGWTFQEGMLCQRRLVFTQTQAYFQCRHMQCVESFSAPVPFDHRILTSAIFPRHCHDNRIVDDDGDETDGDGIHYQTWINKLARTFFSYINKYAGRDFARDADAYNAFRGIQTLFRAMNPPLHLLLGLPIISPVAKGAQESARHPPKSDHHAHDEADASANKELAISLCWSFESSSTMTNSRIKVEEPTRRSCFPSWTWLGWKRGRPSGYYNVLPPYKRSINLKDLEDNIEDVMRYHIHSAFVEFEGGAKLAWDSHWREICDQSDTRGVKSLEIVGWLFEDEEGSTNLVLASCYTPGMEVSENYPETLFALRLQRLLGQDTYDRVGYQEYYSDEAYERVNDVQARFGSISLRRATICLR